ncbi:MAG: bifunctional nuclease family protein [Ilumatobacter sp.]|nr:bifunctional nuclease family protein [Ilumatobacter sp.]
MTPLELVGVRIEVPANTPMMLLQESGGDRRLLPIYIGNPEAQSIHTAIEGIDPPRPLTHDLFVSVLAETGATLERVVITEVREHTFYAELQLKVGDEECTVSARPSDAVALAVRSGTPIFATEALLDAAGQPAEVVDEDEGEEAEIIDEFKDFIEHVNPDDFAT